MNIFIIIIIEFEKLQSLVETWDEDSWDYIENLENVQAVRPLLNEEAQRRSANVMNFYGPSTSTGNGFERG